MRKTLLTATGGLVLLMLATSAHAEDADECLSYEIDNTGRGYLRVDVPTGNYFYPYLIGGITHANASIETVMHNYRDASTRNVSDSSMSFGFGASITSPSGNGHYEFEYMKYFDKDGLEVSGISAGYSFKF